MEVTLFGFDDYIGSVFTVEYKEIEDVGLITLISKTGTLVVTVESGEGEPLDAIVTVKDAAGNVIDSLSVVGGTASMEVIVGTYMLEAAVEGYQPQVVTNISIESGTTVNQQFILYPAPGSVKIYLQDSEGLPIPEAEVLLDGESMGATDETGNLVIYDVSPEDHSISVQKEGFTSYTEIQTVNPGETLILEVTMEKGGLNPIYIAIPVLAVAALAGAVFFLRSRGAGEPTTKERAPVRGKEKSRIPTGARREGLPKQSYRGRP